MRKYVLGILFSGGGTTAEAIVKAIQDKRFQHIAIGCAVSSSPQAKGVERLHTLNVPVYIVDPKDFRAPNGKRDAMAFGEKIISLFQKHTVNLVTQNGWIPLTPQNVVETYIDMIFNQHPGPVPEFGGKGMVGLVVHETMLLFQKKAKRVFPTEVVAHRVTVGLDEGAIVQKTEVPILLNDTAEILQTRALPIEHQTQINVLHAIDENTLSNLPPRKVPLVKGSEIKLLEKAKQEAIEKYKSFSSTKPKGAWRSR
ncbi:phosphoribosylglycinamide formyltransferase [soil metagenome]